LVYGFFFFSSRRRHTRSIRDWSSDVCSSDLGHQRLVELLLSDEVGGNEQLAQFVSHRRHRFAPSGGKVVREQSTRNIRERVYCVIGVLSTNNHPDPLKSLPARRTRQTTSGW